MERKVKTFFHVFIKSFVPHAAYYSKIIKTSFSFSFKYFTMLIVALNLIFVAYIIAKYNPQKINLVLTSLSSNLAKYPDDLTINVFKGRLVTSNNHPYFLWLDQGTNKNLFLVVDESADSQKIIAYKSTSLLTAQELVTLNPDGIRTFPLNYLEDQKITKNKVNQMVKTIDAMRAMLPLLYVLFVLAIIVVVPFISFVVTLVYLTVASLMVFFIFKFFMFKHFKLRKIFQISLHTVTFPLVLDYFVMMLRPTIRMGTGFLAPLKQIPFPMLFLIILAVFTAVGVYEAHENGVKKV